MVTAHTHLAALLALLLGAAQTTDAHRYRTHHHGRRLFKPSFEMATVEAFRPFHTPSRGSGLFTSAGPLVDVFQEVVGDMKRVARELSDPAPTTRTPPHEVVETEDAAIVTADLPGCKKEDVDAQISEDGGTKMLTIRAVRKKPVLTKKDPDPSSRDASDPDQGIVDPSEAPTAAVASDTPIDGKETSSSSSSSSPASPSYTEESFKLSFSVGDAIDVSGIRGSFEDGVLTLVLPKLTPEPPAEPIEIPIDFAAGSGSLEGARRATGGRGRVGATEEASNAAEADTHISLS
eukprot:g5423.t1